MLTYLFSQSLNSKLPRIVSKSRRTSKGGLEWPYWVVDMMIEMLTNRTPPNSITPNILTVCKLVSPNFDIVKELPGDRTLRQSRSVLAVHTKTLGASQIAGCKEMLEHKSDGTSRRGVTFSNSIVRIADANGYKNVALSSATIAKDGTAAEEVVAIQRTFADGRELLLHWRKVTERMYPSQRDLLDRIPEPSKLSLARLHKMGG